MLPEPKISYKPFWGICRPLNSWRANSPNPIQIYCAFVSNDTRTGFDTIHFKTESVTDGNDIIVRIVHKSFHLHIFLSDFSIGIYETKF